MNKIIKALLIASLAVLFFAIILSIIFAKKSFAFSTANADPELNDQALIPLNKNAASACIKDLQNPYMFYKFTEKQKAELKSFRNLNGSCALQILLESLSSKIGRASCRERV